MATLGGLLASDYDCTYIFRRPLIALMSEPFLAHGELSFKNRHSSYILNDLSKRHLDELLATDCDFVIFDLLSDIRCPLIQIGSSYFFHPNKMHTFVSDAPKDLEVVDLDDFLRGREMTFFGMSSKDFFEVWVEHFDRFHTAFIQRCIDRGCRVISNQIFYASSTNEVIGSDIPLRSSINATLRRMYEHVNKKYHIESISISERLCVTATDAPFGESWSHPTHEIFEGLVAQVRDLMSAVNTANPHDKTLSNIHARLDAIHEPSFSRKIHRMLNRVARKRPRLAGFDERYYLHWYKDVASFRAGAAEHYLRYGWREGRDPSSGFSTNGYLYANPDVAALDICPLLHFNEKGIAEGRRGWRKKQVTAAAPIPRVVEAGLYGLHADCR